MWLVCGRFQTRGTWVDGFFPGAGRFFALIYTFFVAIANAARMFCTLKQIPLKKKKKNHS